MNVHTGAGHRACAAALAAVCLATATFAAQATKIRVPADVATIQGAIDAAVNRDRVLVAPGTYPEWMDFNSKAITASRIGLVLVTPALQVRLPRERERERERERVADKELSALLAGNRLVPTVHNKTYEPLRNVSPLLASRSGLDTAEDSMAKVAAKIAQLVAL